MKNSYLILFVIMPLFVKAQISDYNKVLSPQEFRSDFDSLKIVIETVHPNAFHSYSQILAEKNFDSIKNTINKPMTVFQFNQMVKPYVTLFKDGHTYLSYSWKFWEKSDLKLFPLKVKINKKNLEVTIKQFGTKNTDSIPIGSRITSINGIDIYYIIQTMKNYISAESDNFLLSSIENSFGRLLWEAFDFKTDFTVKYILPKGVAHDVTVAGITMNEIWELGESEGSSENYSYRTFPDKNICILEFNSFNNLAKFDSLLVNMFTEIKENKIENLIIDLRNNGGGNSILGDELLQYIAKEPFSMFGPTIIKTSPYQKRFIQKYRNAGYYKTLSDNSIDSLLNKPDGIVYESVELTPLRKNSLRYTGNIYALTSGITFSSASDFAWVLKHYKVATLIGEETGGLITCYGDVMLYTLPHSGLELGISYKKFYGIGATDDDNHGVIPDYLVEPDKALDYAIRLIQSKSIQ